jgi:hypothetical protein
VSFFPGYSCRQPFFSADGQRLYFSSNQNNNSDIWVVSRTEEGWGIPQRLPEPINTSSYDGMYTETIDGTIYIESMRPGGRGGIDIWQISPAQPGQARQIRNFSTRINTSGDDNDPVISLDGRYLIFGSNYNDLFVTFNQGNGVWSAPVNLNQYCPGLNTGTQEYAPFISADGHYLFLSRVYGGGIHWVANPIPSPDPNGPVCNLSTGDRFATIQAAIVYAQPGDTIEIQPGIYRESLVLDKDVTLQSVDPNDPFYIGGTIIQGDSSRPVVTLQGNTEMCSLAGLTLRTGTVGISGTDSQANLLNCRIMDNVEHGIELSHDSHFHILHCLITANSKTGITMITNTRGRSVTFCKPTIEDCVIVDNGETGIVGGQPVIVDSLIQEP